MFKSDSILYLGLLKLEPGQLMLTKEKLKLSTKLFFFILEAYRNSK